MKYTLTILFVLSLLGTVSVRAQETASESSDTVTQTLKERVQKVLQNDQGKVEGATTTVRTTFGLVGNLQKVVGSTLQIATYGGPTRIAELEKSAVITRQGRSIQFEEVELNSPVIATGVFDADGTYRIKRLSTLTEPVAQSKRHAIVGILTAITSRNFTMDVTAGASEASLTLHTTARTTYFDIMDTKIERRLLKAAQQVVTIIPGELTATSSASRVYVLTPVSTASALPAL